MEAVWLEILSKHGPAWAAVAAFTLLVAQVVTLTRWITQHADEHAKMDGHHEAHAILLSEMKSAISALNATCRERMSAFERNQGGPL